MDDPQHGFGVSHLAYLPAWVSGHLPPFPMWPAFPSSEYYGGSVALRLAARRASRAPSPAGQVVGNVAGLALIVLGGAMMVLAAIRFRRTARDIDSAATVPGGGVRLDLWLTGLLLLLGAVLFGYLLYTVLRRF